MIKKIMPLTISALILLTTTGFTFDKIHGSHSVIQKENYDSLYQAAVPVVTSEEARSVIANCIEAYGGMEHLEGLNSYRLTYDMMVIGGKRPVETVKTYQRARKYKIVSYKDSGFESRIINGLKSWYITSDTAIYLNSGRYKAELFSYLTLSMPLAIERERFDGVRFGQRGNDSLMYIYMKKEDSLMIVVGIDPEDNYIKKSEGVIYQDTLQFIFINHFDDFDIYDGYVFPGKLVNVSMGLEVARSSITSIDINPSFKESEFQPNAESESILR